MKAIYKDQEGKTLWEEDPYKMGGTYAIGQDLINNYVQYMVTHQIHDKENGVLEVTLLELTPKVVKHIQDTMFVIELSAQRQ